MRLVIYPYSLVSEGARNLARALDALRVREVGRYEPRRDDLIVNWGNPRVPGWWNARARANTLNHPEQVRNAINKIRTFELLRENNVPIPDFALTRDAARQLFRSESSRVLCRTLLSGHSGRGITIANDARSLVDAPLYVKYVPKTREYRLHVLNDEVIDVEQKRRRNGVEQNQTERLVRSHRHGWVFTRNDINPVGNEIRDIAIRSVRALGLQFGAVDLGWHERHGVRVYEVNTAPGIEGTTVRRYQERLERLADV